MSDEQTTRSRGPPRAASLPNTTEMNIGLNEFTTPLSPSMIWIRESYDR